MNPNSVCDVGTFAETDPSYHRSSPYYFFPNGMRINSECNFGDTEHGQKERNETGLRLKKLKPIA